MPYSKTTVMFFALILAIGVLTSMTDLKTKKIYNSHLFWTAALGLIVIISMAVTSHENPLFHFINAGLAFCIGYSMFRFELWKGGDAKLFTLYAFLMPPLAPRGALFNVSAFNLFVCSFIAGMVILIPLFIKDIILNHKTTSHSQTFKQLFLACCATIFLSWVFFPLYYFIKIIHVSGVILAATCLLFYLVHRFITQNRRPSYTVIGLLIVLSFLLRLFIDPQLLSWKLLIMPIVTISLFSILSTCIFATLDTLKEYDGRMAFAPLLFIGCILSYTPLITWFMHR